MVGLVQASVCILLINIIDSECCAMSKRNTQNLDIKLLAVFNEMFKTGSVSVTANTLHMTQPAVSMCLSRLRKHFADALFVRAGSVMAPTPQALFLQEPLCRAYQLLTDASRAREPFFPFSSTRVFRIAMVDAGYLALFPLLFDFQKKEAPNLRFEFRTITKETGALMAAGEIDLTIAFMPQLGPGIYQQLLLEQDFVAAVRCNHPRIGSGISLADYATEQHLEISPSGTGHWVLNNAIEEVGLVRNIGWRADSYLAIPPILPVSDYIVTIPEAMARFFAERSLLKYFKLPFKAPEIVVMQHWHERFHRDPGLLWLRRTFQELFEKLE